MLRVMLFTAQDSPLGDLAPDEVRALVRHDAVNSEHYIDITTTRTLEKGWRIVYRDAMGKWREYVVDGIDQAHAEGAPVGTYRCVWSVQHDLMGVPCDKMPGVQTPVSAQLALDAALSLTSRWVRGTVTQSTTAGASMWRMSAWSALGVLVENWGGEVAATIEVGRDAVSARKVDLLSHAGKEQPTRRFEYGADVTGIQRKVADSPNVSRIIPLGAAEQTDTGGNGRKIDITSVNGGREYLENAAVRNAYRLPDGQGGWEHPTAYVENPEADTPAKLKAWAQANLQSYTVPQVSYTASVAAFEAAGLDAKGIAEGDAVQVVDDDMGLRVEARVQSLDVNELMPTDQQVTIGNMSQALPSMLSSLSSKVGRAVETVQIINGDGFNTEGWLERTRERMNAEANATGGYTYITQGQGIRTYDVAVADPQSGLEANQVVEVKGGTIRIADSKTSSGDWDWKTVIESGHIAADLVTAAHITAGYIGSAGGTFIDLDNDLVQLGESDGVHVYIDSNGLGIDPANVDDATLTGGSLTSFTATGTRIGRYAVPHVFVNDSGFGINPANVNDATLTGGSLAAFTSSGARIGLYSGKHATITDSGLEVLNGSTSLAVMGPNEMRLGKTADYHYYGTATSLGLYPGGNSTASNAMFYVDNTPSVRVGKLASTHLYMTSSGFGINPANVNDATYEGGSFSMFTGTAARLGKYASPHLYIDSTSVQLRPATWQAGSTVYVTLNSGGVQVGIPENATYSKLTTDSLQLYKSGMPLGISHDQILLTNSGGGILRISYEAGNNINITNDANGRWTLLANGSLNLPDGGSILEDKTDIEVGTTASKNINALTVRASGGEAIGQVRIGVDANKDPYTGIIARRGTGSGLKQRGLYVICDPNGKAKYTVHDPDRFLDALGIGSTIKSSTIADNATAAANISLTSVEYASWGKTAMVRIRFTTTVARSGNWNVCTMASGKRPAYVAGVTCWAKPTLTGNMSAAGVVKVSGEVAANTDMVVLATYVLA